MSIFVVHLVYSKFTKYSFLFHIFQNATVGFSVLTLSATDKDQGSNAEFVFEFKDGAQVFICFSKSKLDEGVLASLSNPSFGQYKPAGQSSWLVLSEALQSRGSSHNYRSVTGRVEVSIS